MRTRGEKSPALVVLIVRAGARDVAVPLRHVSETMRPLPIEPVAGMPGFVRGVSVIRGIPVPVVDLGALLLWRSSGGSGRPGADFGRFVTLKLGVRRGAIGVDAVVGLRSLDPAQLRALPPILGDVGADLIEAIGTRDGELLVVLRAARIVPDEAWARLSSAEAAR